MIKAMIVIHLAKISILQQLTNKLIQLLVKTTMTGKHCKLLKQQLIQLMSIYSLKFCNLLKINQFMIQTQVLSKQFQSLTVTTLKTNSNLVRAVFTLKLTKTIQNKKRNKTFQTPLLLILLLLQQHMMPHLCQQQVQICFSKQPTLNKSIKSKLVNTPRLNNQLFALTNKLKQQQIIMMQQQLLQLMTWCILAKVCAPSCWTADNKQL